MKNFLIVKNCNNFVEEIVEYFESLRDAEKALDNLSSHYEDEMFEDGEDFFSYEDDYGSIYTYQIVELNKNKLQ